ncbi:MAG: tyrosine-type recombinase/integrase [Bacilli bacterium]|jgi:integrase
MTVGIRTWRSRKTGEEQRYWEIRIDRSVLDGVAKPVRKRAEVQTQRGAEQEETQIRKAILGGIYDDRAKEKEVVAQEIPTLKKFSEEFIKSYAKVNNKETEVIAKEGNLRRYLLPAFEGKRLDEIRFRDIERFKVEMLERELSPKTTNNALATLSRLLRWAEECEVLASVPRIRHLTVPEQESDFLTFEEAERLLAAAVFNPEWRGMIFFAMRTGLRYGELCELKWSDIDLVAKRMRVRRSCSRRKVTDRKNRSAYTVPLSPDTVAFLKARKHLKGDLVFCMADGGRHIHRRADVAIKLVCKKAGLRPIGWHTLRHTFGSHLAMRGRSLLEIKELMGHKDIKSTLRYAHLMPESRAEAIAVLDAPAPFSTEQMRNIG